MPVAPLGELVVQDLLKPGERPSEELDDFGRKITDPRATLDELAALVANVPDVRLDLVWQKVTSGREDYSQAAGSTRRRVAETLSKVLERRQEDRGSTLILKPHLRIKELPPTERLYAEAFAAAGIRAGLTGEPDSINAAAMQAMLHVVTHTKGLELRTFLIDVVLGAPNLEFYGMTTGPHDNAAAFLIAAAQNCAETAPADSDALNKLETGLLEHRPPSVIAAMPHAVAAARSALYGAAEPRR